MLFACTATCVGGCADSIREYTTSFQGWLGRKPDAHVFGAAADRDAAAYRASSEMLTEADWAVLTRYAPKPIWQRIVDARRKAKAPGLGPKSPQPTPTGAPTAKAPPPEAKLPEIPRIQRPDGKVDLFYPLRHYGGIGVTSSRDGGTDRRKVTTTASNLQPLVDLLKTHLAKDEAVSALPSENKLVITIAPAKEELIRRVLAQVDTSRRQVEITSRIFEVSHDFDFRLGAQLLLKRIGSETSLGMASRFSAKDFAQAVVDPLVGKVIDPGAALRLLQVFEEAGLSVDATFQALAEVGMITVVATPRMTVAAGQTAYMLAGQELPIQSAIYVNDKFVTEKITYRPTGVQLYITPQVVGAEAIKLHVVTMVSAVAGFGPTPAMSNTSAVSPVTNPIFDTREAETYVTVRNGNTLVIGGLRMVRTITREAKVPGLGDVEAIEWLFKNHRSKKMVNDLYFFVTPRLVD